MTPKLPTPRNDFEAGFLDRMLEIYYQGGIDALELLRKVAAEQPGLTWDVPNLLRVLEKLKLTLAKHQPKPI